MNPASADIDVVIAGGGPVGLWLAGRLIQRGISCRVLEKRNSIDGHSKSLGIHPVSLEMFDQAGITGRFLEKGLKIRKGIAFWNRSKIGEISFEKCPAPHNYILALPQWQTEQILEEWLLSLDRSVLIRGAEVCDINEGPDGVNLTFSHNKMEQSVKARFLAGCDGKNSFVRRSLKIPFHGAPYPDCYIMGDFTDNTSFGSDAAVYLHREGLIESFPLPDGRRRWVVKTGKYEKHPAPQQLLGLIKNRLGHSLLNSANFMISSFGVQQMAAEKFHSKRALLAGDAAHVVSPIGGQGMNLGWLGAELCAEQLSKALQNPQEAERYFKEYSDKQRKNAKQAARRAELNMHLGRKESSTALYRFGVKMMLRPPLSRLMANLFTMRGLGKWPV